MGDLEDRLIALIDMDCFFCQVEAREHPELRGKPMVVSQFNLVLAVNYEARDLGVSRFVRAEEAVEKCPELNVVSVPIVRGKGDVSKYRAAGQEVINILKMHCPTIERASVDEAYLDITDLVEMRMASMSCSIQDLLPLLPNTYVVGYCGKDNNQELRDEGLKMWVEESLDNLDDLQARKLAVAAIIIEEFRSEILEKCQFKCSGGISYNKVLAKLACGLHKPNRQTILAATAVPTLFSTLPVNKVRNLGGKIGKSVVEKLGCSVMADLLQFSLRDLQKHFDEKTGLWLHNIARGIDNEPVTSRLISKSIGASKNFSGQQIINNLETLTEWVNILSEDVSNRLQQDLEDNHRRATALTITYQVYHDQKTVSHSRALSLPSYKAERIASLVLDIVTKALDKAIVGLSIATSKFVNVGQSMNLINYFKAGTKQPEDIEDSKEAIEQTEKKCSDVENVEKTTLVQLKEIFPDLNDIDQSVVEILPPELQREAKVYLKLKEKSGTVSSVAKTHSVKDKSANSKSATTNTLRSFVVRTSVSEISSMVRCSECNQMVKNEKYLEHMDFHVAHNLQRDMYESPRNTVKSWLKRNRENETRTSTSNKKAKSIESYFFKARQD